MTSHNREADFGGTEGEAEEEMLQLLLCKVAGSKALGKVVIVSVVWEDGNRRGSGIEGGDDTAIDGGRSIGHGDLTR